MVLIIFQNQLESERISEPKLVCPTKMLCDQNQSHRVIYQDVEIHQNSCRTTPKTKGKISEKKKKTFFLILLLWLKTKKFKNKKFTHFI